MATRPDTNARLADEVLLRLIGMRCLGLSTFEIAARTGLSNEYVRTATNRVQKADAAESGEDISAAYWGQKGEAA